MKYLCRELIKMHFGMLSRVCPENHTLNEVAHWRLLANTIKPVHVRRRCILMSNYFDHLLLLVIITIIDIIR